VTHTPCDTDLQHDSLLDVTTAREPTPAQREVLDLLGLDPDRRRLVRLTVEAWRQVEAVAGRLAEARREGR
jgi:hypothetical protein